MRNIIGEVLWHYSGQAEKEFMRIQSHAILHNANGTLTNVSLYHNLCNTCFLNKFAFTQRDTQPRTYSVSIKSFIGERTSNTAIVRCMEMAVWGGWIEYGIHFSIHIIPYDAIKSSIAHLNLQVSAIDAIYWLLCQWCWTCKFMVGGNGDATACSQADSSCAAGALTF